MSVNKLLRQALPVTVLLICMAAKPLDTNLRKPVVNWKNINVLVYTKNGKGYVHTNIAAATSSIQALAKKNGFGVTVSDNPADFTDANLKKFAVLIFNNTNND